MPWSDHFTLKAQLSAPTPPSLGSKVIYAHSQKLENALWDPMPLMSCWMRWKRTGTVDSQWNQSPTPSLLLSQVSPVVNHRVLGNETGATIARISVVAYENISEVCENILQDVYENLGGGRESCKEQILYATSIASFSPRPAQLFKIIRYLTSLLQWDQKVSKLTISCKAFASYFGLKSCHSARHYWNNMWTEGPLAIFKSSNGPLKQLCQDEVNRILAAGKATTCHLGLCPSRWWNLKVPLADYWPVPELTDIPRVLKKTMVKRFL